MIKALIIDDEPLARSIVKEYLQSYPDIELVQECNDGFEGVKAVQQHQPDLIFLDIQMPKINGFEMLELLDKAPAVIFTTAFDHYAIQAFESLAIDYLMKPFSKERFDKAVQKWLANRQSNKSEELKPLLNNATKQPDEGSRVVVKTGNAIRIIPAPDIIYLEAFDDYVKIYTKEGFHLKKKTMNYFEQVLDASMFIRTHRSYIINLKELTKIESMEKDSHIVLLKSGARIPLSKTGYSKLKSALDL